MLTQLHTLRKCSCFVALCGRPAHMRKALVRARYRAALSNLLRPLVRGLSSQQDCIKHFARTARALRSEASCPNFEASCPRPNFEPRAHARLTGLTSSRIMLRATGLFHLVSDLHDARCAVTQPLGSRAATLVAWRASRRA